MIRSVVAVSFSTALALAISACPAMGQFSDGPGTQANIDGFAVLVEDHPLAGAEDHR